MEVTIEEAIQHIKNSCYIVGYPTHDKQDETRKRINASLDMAIDIMCKYQKIKEILNSAGYIKNGTVYSYTYDEDSRVKHIREVVEDGKID